MVNWLKKITTDLIAKIVTIDAETRVIVTKNNSSVVL